MGQFDFTSDLTPIKLHDHSARHEYGGVDVIETLGDLSLFGGLTVGVDDTGHDVKFFGATSGVYLLWDESADKLDIVAGGRLALSGNIPATFDVSGGHDGISGVLDFYPTLTAGQEYRAGYYRANYRSTSPGNPVVNDFTGLEGVAASYTTEEGITFRGGHFRTYINADSTSTMRTAIGAEMSTRASYYTGTECVAEGGTAFVGARIWMAPYFTSGSLANLNNFWGLWIYGEHATQRNADSAIKISDAGGGFTYDITFQEGTTLVDDGTDLTLAGANLVLGAGLTLGGALNANSQQINSLATPTSSTDATTKEYVDAAVASMVWEYFLNDTASGADSYYTMSQTATGDEESSFTTASLGQGDAQALTEWISDAAVPFLVIRKGQLDFHIHAARTGTRSVVIYAELYEYKTDTSEVLIATSEDSDAITDKAGVGLHATLANDYTLATGSKLLVKYLVDLGTGGPTTIVLYAEGTLSSSVNVSVLSSSFDDVYLRLSTYNANTILAATSDDTPVAVTVAEQRIIGRQTSGNIAALTGANALLAMGIGATIAEIDLLDLAGLDTGSLLVATAAGTAAWQSTGVVLTSPDINSPDIDGGTIDGVTITAPNIDGWVTNTGAALVLPAHSVGGTLAMGANNITLDATQTVDGIDVSAHDVATNGVHGAGANTILYSDHTADADAHGEPVVTCDTNSATADDLAFSIVGGEGIDTSGSTTVVTITGEAASTTNKGVVELAIGSEVNTGTSTTLAVTPDALDDWTGSAQITTLGTISSVAGNIAMGGNAVTGHAQAIADNAILTVDHVTPVATDYARFTANGLEGREKSEVLGDLNVADGADVTGSSAPQAHKGSHQDTGTDEISVAGLLGETAELTTHKANTTTAHGAVVAATASKIVIRDAQGQAKFAAPAEAGDALIKGTPITSGEYPAVTDENYLVGTGTSMEERAVPTGATKEIFASVYGYLGGGTVEPNQYGVRINSAAEAAYVAMLIPQDFTAITALEVILIPAATGANMKWHFTTYFGAYNGGEAFEAGSEVGAGRDVGATVFVQNIAHDIADLVTGLAAGDILIVKILYSATAIASNGWAKGLRLKYS